MWLITVKTKKTMHLQTSIDRFRYEAFIFIFFLFRFAFENLPKIGRYFTVQPIFDMSEKASIAVGTVVLLTTCLGLAFLFGKLLNSGAAEQKKHLSCLVALFLASPVSFPFLYNSQAVNGSQLLYPFALFVFALIISQSSILKWLLPAICVLFLVPATLTSESLFSYLQRGAILYIPLLLLFLLLKLNFVWQKTSDIKSDIKSDDFVLFAVCFLACIGSYLYSYKNGNLFQIPFFFSARNPTNGFFSAAVVALPALIVGGWLFREITKSRQTALSPSVFFLVHILSFPTFKYNIIGLWIPFLLISTYMFIFIAHQRQQPSAVTAIEEFGVFVEKHGFLFLILLMIMALLSNHSSYYLSDFLRNFFYNTPF